MLETVKDRARRHHEHAAAAHLLRMPDLAQAMVLLNDARLFEEATTLVRVAVELAITAQWIGTDDEKAFWLALDSADATERGDKLRKEHLGLGAGRNPIEGAKRLPPLPQRAKDAGPDAEAFYAGIYQWGSSPTHGALSILGHLEDDERDQYGRMFAALGVQAVYRLAIIPLKILHARAEEIPFHAALNEWRATR
jgi:hypothetical protein